MTAFISGHLDLTEEEFQLHYKNRILEAIEKGHDFCTGDARGADLMAQRFVEQNSKGNKLYVAHMFKKPRNAVGSAILMDGYTSDEQRDTSMTMHSDYDIAWVRPGREKSGTMRNIQRRAEVKQH